MSLRGRLVLLGTAAVLVAACSGGAATPVPSVAPPTEAAPTEAAPTEATPTEATPTEPATAAPIEGGLLD
ncbi:MAG: hypothetical protein MUQ32_03445, partial [Chloroflexi bacterium]|nr:hypothetical protein [Chloroflexota bacterium]